MQRLCTRHGLTFSKNSAIGILHSKLSSTLTFEKCHQRITFRKSARNILKSLRSSISEVSALQRITFRKSARYSICYVDFFFEHLKLSALRWIKFGKSARYSGLHFERQHATAHSISQVSTPHSQKSRYSICYVQCGEDS